jgi:hypothetical protein
MKTAKKNGKSNTNGVQYTRKELIVAHQRALKRVGKINAGEGLCFARQGWHLHPEWQAGFPLRRLKAASTATAILARFWPEETRKASRVLDGYLDVRF